MKAFTPKAIYLRFWLVPCSCQEECRQSLSQFWTFSEVISVIPREETTGNFARFLHRIERLLAWSILHHIPVILLFDWATNSPRNLSLRAKRWSWIFCSSPGPPRSYNDHHRPPLVDHQECRRHRCAWSGPSGCHGDAPWADADGRLVQASRHSAGLAVWVKFKLSRRHDDSYRILTVIGWIFSRPYSPGTDTLEPHRGIIYSIPRHLRWSALFAMAEKVEI